MTFDRTILNIDAPAEASRIATWLRQHVRGTFRKQGAVVGVSGGVDSAVVLGLCVKAFGAGSVVALLMPERESSAESERLGRAVCATYGVEAHMEDLTAALEGFGCYQRRDEAVQRVIPDYEPSHGSRFKITLPQDLMNAGTLNTFAATVVDAGGREHTKPLPKAEFLQVTAASNFKQRARAAMAYYHAELRNYAVVGTANKNERDQGFFVKHGDGAADVQAIAHLYKTQVYQLAAYIGVPGEIIERTPTTDTYSAPCSQEEFFFRIPFDVMDLIWEGAARNVPAASIAEAVGLEGQQVQRVIDDIRRKRRSTEFLRAPALALDTGMAVENGSEVTPV